MDRAFILCAKEFEFYFKGSGRPLSVFNTVEAQSDLGGVCLFARYCCGCLGAKDQTQGLAYAKQALCPLATSF
jgi:hypothetical protein